MSAGPSHFAAVSVSTARRNTPTVSAKQRLTMAALLVVSLGVPFFFEPFRVLQLALVLVWVVAAASLNLLSGFGGILSVGAGAFVGIGAYTAAILRERGDQPFIVSVLAAGAVCFVLGLAVGLPALRLRGLYLALVTLGLSSCLPLVLTKYSGLTGGSQGFVVQSLPGVGGLSTDQVTYLSVWLICALALASMTALVRGPAGRAIRATRDNEIVAASFGVNPAVVKTMLFGISSMMAGAAGAGYVASVGYAAPDAFPLHLSVVILIACVVGGLRTVLGSVIAGLFVVYVPIWIGDVVGQSFADVAYGVVVIGFLILLPGGLAGELARRRLRRRLSAPVTAPGTGDAVATDINPELAKEIHS
jgi:branched-chain amino acid transport system permease protein